MARTKHTATKSCKRKTKATKPKSIKVIAKSSKHIIDSKSSLTKLLRKEHEDDVHEAILGVLQTKKISKQQLLKMAKYGGIENYVGMTLYFGLFFKQKKK